MAQLAEPKEITQERLLIERDFVRYNYPALLPFPFYTHANAPGTLLRLDKNWLCVVDVQGNWATVAIATAEAIDYWLRAMAVGRDW